MVSLKDGINISFLPYPPFFWWCHKMFCVSRCFDLMLKLLYTWCCWLRTFPTIANHVKSFRHEKHQSDTELSNDLLSIKNNYILNITSEILRKHKIYNPTTKRYFLCLNQKLKIARYKGHNLLNKRSEIINKCRHQIKFVLALYDSKDWIKFSVTAFEPPYVKNHSFPKSDCFRVREINRVSGISAFLCWLAYLANMHMKSQFSETCLANSSREIN